MKQTNKLKIRIIYIFLSIGTFISAQNLSNAFIGMPDEMIPVLNAQQKYELTEYARLNAKDSVQNIMGAYASVVRFDTVQNNIIVRPASNITVELQLFNNKPYSYAVITTMLSPIPSSSIAFYNNAWKQVSVDLKRPQATDWLDTTKIEAAQLSLADMKRMTNTSFITLTFSDKSTISATNNSADFLSVEDKKTITPYLKNNQIRFSL